MTEFGDRPSFWERVLARNPERVETDTPDGVDFGNLPDLVEAKFGKTRFRLAMGPEGYAWRKLAETLGDLELLADDIRGLLQGAGTMDGKRIVAELANIGYMADNMRASLDQMEKALGDAGLRQWKIVEASDPINALINGED